MRFWIDAQLPRGLAPWLGARAGCEATHLLNTPLAACPDQEIFLLLREAGNVVVTKDADFVDLVSGLDQPPQTLWLRLGNLTNLGLRTRLTDVIDEVLTALRAGEKVVEVRPLVG